MSLHFCYRIQKNKVSFWCKKQNNKKTKNNMELWTHSAMYLWFVFSWHTLGHTIWASLSIVVEHARITLYPSYCGWFQHNNILQTSDHLNLVSWTWAQTVSAVSKSQSNRSPLEHGGTRDSHYACATDKSGASVQCCHVDLDQNLWRMYPAPSLMYVTKN